MTAADRASRARTGDRALRCVGRFRLTIGICLTFSVAMLWARAVLGVDASKEIVTRFGYGLAAFEGGRPWTVATGFPLQSNLSVLPHLITVVSLGLCERLASHWRTLVAFVAGHVVAVCTVAASLWALEGVGNDWLREMARTLDVGSSNGAFACLGAFTAFLRAPTRRRVRLGISCYLGVLLLFSGHVYDLSHPVGWIAGVAIGRALTGGGVRTFDTAPWQRRELGWLGLVGVLSVGYGLHDAWAAGGTGGPFGWGPGSLA